MADITIVNGGAQNTGLAIAKSLRDRGENVWILDIKDPVEAGVGRFVRVDLADVESTRQAFDEVNRQGDVTRLINVAGIVALGRLEDMPADQFNHVMNINARSYAQGAQAVLPAMRRRRFGRIVNIASRSAFGLAGQTSYAASKAAVISMTRTWALEEAANGITVNAIAPGPVETELFHRVYPEGSEKKKRYIEAIPVGRLGRVEDIAQAVLFMSDDKSSFITGQILCVCGGITLPRTTGS